MDILRRILTAVFGLFMLAFAAVIAMAMVSRAFAAQLVDFTDRCLLYNMQRYFIEGHGVWLPLLIALLLLVIGILLIFVALWRKKQPRLLNVTSPEGDQVEISVDALDNIVRRTVTSISDVRGLTSHISVLNNELKILLNISVPPNVALPGIGAAVRDAVNTQVEAMTGLHPKEVMVRVSNISDKRGGE